MVKNLPANAGDLRDSWVVQFWGEKNPLEKQMATHSSILAIPWMVEPGGPQSMGLQRVRHSTYSHIQIIATVDEILFFFSNNFAF